MRAHHAIRIMLTNDEQIFVILKKYKLFYRRSETAFDSVAVLMLRLNLTSIESLCIIT